jgi:hypothetical protein
VGALAGSGLGDPKQWGLDGAAVAAFLALLWPRLKGREPVAIAVVCAVATVVAVPFVPAGVPILVAAVVAAVIGWYSHGRSDEGLEPDVEPYREHHRGADHDGGGHHRPDHHGDGRRHGDGVSGADT